MKKLFILALTFVFLLPTSADGFFNRDCSNLKKRTVINQKTYERNWDKYQSAYGRWQAITDSWKKYDNPEAVNRLRVTFKVAQTTLQDLGKYPKCVKATQLPSIQRQLFDISLAFKDLDGNGGFALFKNYLPSPIDYLSYLK
jgi:hypothetical protein